MKRLFDFSIALTFSILFIPLWIMIGILIKITSKGPIFFRQIRVGKNAKEFKIFKYRTMIIDAEKKGLQITIGRDDPRITKVGQILRKTKLDELPQLFNIIIGEMSFVGPRPEVPKYVAMYSEEQREVLKARPGITDIASIKYINENELLRETEEPEHMYITKIMPDKLSLNLKYLEKRNLRSDIYIIIKTVAKIL
jgi:lipopolysaccharide/colanic/teichoic acid biosynthesis glycosyltransferase